MSDLGETCLERWPKRERLNGSAFQFGLQRLRDAYEAAMAVFKKSEETARDQYNRTRQEANYFDQETEKDARHRHDYEMQLGEIIYEAQSSSAHVREAFVISLHHFWEKWLKSVGGENVAKNKRYDHGKAMGFLTKNGLKPDARELTILKLTCEVAKHSDGDSADKLYELRTDLFLNAIIDEDGDLRWSMLNITNETVTNFFETVRKSGPPFGPIRL